MANYFNTLSHAQKLEQMGQCEFMDGTEFTDGIDALRGKKIVIIGCGAQGLNQGLNMRDSGLDIYREVDFILATLPELDIPRLHQLGDKLNREKSSKVLEHTFDIINRWLIKIIKDLAINRKSSIDPWIAVWENTSSLLNQTKGLNLDPKQAILNTFIAIRNSSNNQRHKL